MLKVFRDNLKSLAWVLWLVIAAFILIEFVVFGNNGPASTNSSDVAARVGKETVSFGEFETAYRNMEGFYRQTYGDSFNADFARQIGLHRQVLDSLVADRILLLEADRLDLEITDAELQREILALPVFQKDGGGFIGPEEYQRILRQNNFTVESFEDGMRRDLLLAKVRSVVSAGVYVPESDVEDEYRNQVERAKIRFIRAPYGALAGEVTADEAAIEAHYAENPGTFETPERRVVDYLVVDVDRIRNSISIDPSEARAYYDANADEFSQPEQVRARHILLQVNESRTADEARGQLEEAKAKVLAGESFEALASELSEDPGSKIRGGDLGFFGRGAMVAEFEAAAFSTPPGQMSDPIQSQFGFHLIQVVEKNAGGQRPFEEVEAGITQRLMADRAREAAESKAQELSETLSSAETSMATLAETDDGVSFQSTEPFAEDDNVPSIGRATPFASAAFEMDVGEISEPVRIARGWAILSVSTIEEPRLPPLEEIREQVEAAVLVELERRAALDRLARARSEGVDALAAAADVEVQETESFGRRDPVGALGNDAEIRDAVFATTEGEVVGPFSTDAGAVLVEVVERTSMDPVEFESQKESTRAALENRRAAQLVAALVAERRQQLDVNIDPQLLANFGIAETGPAG